MPTADLNYLPRGERLLEGTITSGQLSAVATTCTVSNPPSASQLPTYIEFEPDSADNRETVRVTDVSGSTITFERGVYNGGTGSIHAANSAYKQKITEKHWNLTVEAIQEGFMMEDSSLTLTRDSDTQFTITGIDHTAFYTAGRYLRFNESDSNIVFVSSSTLSGSDTVVTIDSAYTIPATLNSVELGIQPKNAADQAVLKDATQTLTNKTLTSPTITNPNITAPQISTGIEDANGNEVIKTPATASAVNEITITNSATGNPVQIDATGDDANVSFEINPKGTGVVKSKVTLELTLFGSDADMETGDGKAWFRVPKELDGMNLVAVAGAVYTAGTTGTCDIQVRNHTDTADMLSTKLTIDSAETDSSTAATPAVINTATDDVVEGDIIAIDVDAIHTTPAQGCKVQLTFAKP